MFLLPLLLCVFAVGSAQIYDPVQFKTALHPISDTEAEIIFTATIESGWHVYSTDLDDGPISATFHIEQTDGVEPMGKLTPRGKEVKKFDPIFQIDVRYFETKGEFVQKVKLSKSEYLVTGYLEYGACSDETCLPPTAVPFTFSGQVSTAAQPAATT
jgi:thiol:disulfide interchange protein DsbD